MMVFLHLYLKYTQPLFVQAIMAFKSLYEAKTVKIHILGQNADGDLKRPFKSGPGMFGGMSLPSLPRALSPDRLLTQSIQPPRTLRQIRLPSKRPKNVLVLRKSDIEYFLPGPQSEIYIAVPIYLLVSRVCTSLTALGYSNTVPYHSRADLSATLFSGRK
jgi:hypothetical protein